MQVGKRYPYAVDSGVSALGYWLHTCSHTAIPLYVPEGLCHANPQGVNFGTHAQGEEQRGMSGLGVANTGGLGVKGVVRLRWGGGADPSGVDPEGAQTGGVHPGGAQTEGVDPGGVQTGGVDPGGVHP